MSISTYDKVLIEISENCLELVSEIDKNIRLCDPITYKCECKNTHSRRIKEFFRKPLKSCCDLRITKQKFIDQGDEKFEDGQIWKKIYGFWISNKGNAVNMNGKKLVMDEKGRYFNDNKQHYATRLMACAFKIENYEKLSNNDIYVASFKDGNSNNLNIENIFVNTRTQIGMINGTKSRQVEFGKILNKKIDDYKHLEQRFISELPNHIILEDGSIYNKLDVFGGKRFVTGSKNEDGYLNLNCADKTYKFHRLICMAFHPIEGKTTYDDYKALQVNHKDGNKLNNRKDNLEWVTQSQNINHAYVTNLNKKKRIILQFENKDNDFGVLVKEHSSIAEASRESGVAEHEIRSIANGTIKKYDNKRYLWKFKNEDETEMYRQKYSTKLKDRES